MAMTLQQIVWQVCDEVGFPRPTAIVSSTDQTARQLLAFANREGQELAERAGKDQGWPILRKEYLVTMQSTGLITGCSYTAGINTVTLGSFTSAPQVGWIISASGGSNATAFPSMTTVTAIAGSIVTLSNNATSSGTNVTMSFGQQSYSFPVDFNYIINQTEWDRGYRWQLLGPVSAQEWQVLKSGLSPTGPRRRFRIMAGQLYIDPVPYDTNTLVFEYFSKNWVLTATGASSNVFTTDTDTPIIPDDALTLGVKWRFLESKGMDYQQAYKTYTDCVDRHLSRAAAARVLSLSQSQSGLRLISNGNIPDTGFGQ